MTPATARLRRPFSRPSIMTLFDFCSKALPPCPFTEQTVLDAYAQAVRLENQPAYEMEGRILGYMLIESFSSGDLDALAREMGECEGDDALVVLAQDYLLGFIVPCEYDP